MRQAFEQNYGNDSETKVNAGVLQKNEKKMKITLTLQVGEKHI